MREAGLVVADALEQVRVAVAPGVRTIELDEIAEAVIRGAEQPRHSWATTGTRHQSVFR